MIKVDIAKKNLTLFRTRTPSSLTIIVLLDVSDISHSHLFVELHRCRFRPPVLINLNIEVSPAKIIADDYIPDRLGNKLSEIITDLTGNANYSSINRCSKNISSYCSNPRYTMLVRSKVFQTGLSGSVVYRERLISDISESGQDYGRVY